MNRFRPASVPIGIGVVDDADGRAVGLRQVRELQNGASLKTPRTEVAGVLHPLGFALANPFDSLAF
jgi:hypothetical protein